VIRDIFRANNAVCAATGLVKCLCKQEFDLPML